MGRGRWVITLLFFLSDAWVGSVLAASAGAQYKIVTASEKGTYIVIGRDLATYIAAPVGIDLESLPSAGSAENIRRLRFEPGVKFALVQSDVYQAFLDQAAAGNTNAGTMIRPLRVILPLYNEEINFVVRADSPMNFVHEIKDARINTGPVGSGTALTMTTLYRLMFNTPLPEDKASLLSNEDALLKLITDKSVDVVAIVAGQPAKLFTDMKPEVRQFIKMLKVDPNHPATQAALKTYFKALLRANSYPNLLNEDIAAFAVKAYLVTYDYNQQDTRVNLARFARSLCQNFATLQTSGHPKWKEVELAMPDLGAGWSYYPQTARELQRCIAGRPKPKPKCTLENTVLGLCADK
jgi:TRAP transporter TAXI family solute receptor